MERVAKNTRSPSTDYLRVYSGSTSYSQVGSNATFSKTPDAELSVGGGRLEHKHPCLNRGVLCHVLCLAALQEQCLCSLGSYVSIGLLSILQGLCGWIPYHLMSLSCVFLGR